MNRKQFTILLIVAVLAGGLGYWAYQREHSSWTSSSGDPDKKLIPDLPLNDVGRIRIEQPGQELNLVRMTNRWRVVERWNYPADFADIGGLIRKAWELKPVRNIPVGESQLGRLGLLPPSSGTNNAATQVEFQKEDGQALAALLLGKTLSNESPGASPYGGGGYPVGRYVKLPGQPDAWIVSEAFSDINTSPQEWLDKAFIKVQDARQVSVMAVDPAGSWTLVREAKGSSWNLAEPIEGEKLDSSKASAYNYLLSSPSFNDIVAPTTPPEEIGFDNPRVAVIETFDGFKYTLTIGGTNTEDNHFLRVSVAADFPAERTPAIDEKEEDKERLEKEFQENTKKLQEKLDQERALENWTYVVSKWTIDALLRNRQDLMAKETAEAEAAPAEADHEGHDHGAEGEPAFFDLSQPPVFPPPPGARPPQPQPEVELPAPGTKPPQPEPPSEPEAEAPPSEPVAPAPEQPQPAPDQGEPVEEPQPDPDRPAEAPAPIEEDR